MSRLFNNPGETVKSLFKSLCYFCLIIGTVSFFIGVLMILTAAAADEYVTFADVMSYTALDYAAGLDTAAASGYLGKVICQGAFYLVLGGLGTLPVYVLGSLACDVAEMKKLYINGKNHQGIMKEDCIQTIKESKADFLGMIDG